MFRRLHAGFHSPLIASGCQVFSSLVTHSLCPCLRSSTTIPVYFPRFCADESERARRLEEQRRKRIEQQQEEIDAAAAQWLVHKAELEEERRKQRLVELKQSERRMGLRPRGTAYKIGTGSSGAQQSTRHDDLYD